MKRLFLRLLCLAISHTCLFSASAQQVDEFPTKEISLFKDGTALFFKQGYFSTNSTGQVLLSSDLFPQALETGGSRTNSSRYAKFPFMIGTMNWNAPGNTIKQIQRRTLPKLDSVLKPIETLTDLIKANKGKKARVSLVENRAFEGRIFSSTEKEVYLYDGKNYFFAPIKEIRDFKFIDEPVATHKAVVNNSNDYETRSSRANEYNPWELQISLEKPNNRQLIEFRYMRSGITWLPIYQIELLPNKKIKLDFKAEVVNDLEAFTQAKLNLMVGVPSFAFSHGEDPLVSGQSLTEYMYLMRNKPSASDYENQFSRQRSSNISMDQFLGSIPFEGEGQQNGDLFFYELKDVSLCTQCRGLFNLVSMELDYEDLYSLKLAGNQEDTHSEEEKKINNTLQVWHAIKFFNATGKPFTTGPAFFYKIENGSSIPQGQQLLEFTPKGLSTVVKITIAPEIQAESIDLELSRERIDIDKYNYENLVKIKGQIRIKNHKTIPVELNVERPIKGDLKSSSLPWKIIALATNLSSLNKNNLATWNLTLKPGEEKTIEYFYDFLDR